MVKADEHSSPRYPGLPPPRPTKSGHDFLVEEAAFGRGLDVAGADGEVAEVFALLPFRGIAADDRCELVDDLLRFDRGLVEFVQP